MHYYQFNIGDYAKHTNHLTMLENLAYRLMLDRYYLTEKPLESDVKKLARLLGMAGMFTEVEQVLEDFFVLEIDGWTHEKIEIELSEYRAKADTARANGRKGGRPKKTQNKPKANPEITQSVNLANPEITGSQANHKPLTINHKPITNNQVSKECGKTSSITGLDFITESQWAEICKIKKTATKQKLTSRSETMLVNNLKKINEAGFSMEQVLNTWSEYPNWKTITVEYMQNQITGAGNGISQGFNNSSAKQSNGQGRTIDVFDLERPIFGGATSDT